MTDTERITIPAETTVAAIALVVGLMTLNYLPVGGFYDDGLYTILAKALATGQGYRFLNLPGAPAAVHFPPGYPLLLALLWKIAPSFPANLLWFKLVNVLLLSVIAWTTCRYAVRVLMVAPWLAVLGTLLGTVTIPILVLTNMLLSEPFFLALLVPALILAEEMARRAPVRREALWLGVLSGVVILVRSIGIVFPVAVAAVWVARRARRAAAWYLAATLVVVSPWLLWSAAHAHDVAPVLQGAYGSYLGWFMGGLHAGGLPFLIATIRINAIRLALGIAGSLQAAPPPAVLLTTVAVVLLLFGYGAWRVRRRAPVTLVFLALYLAIVLAWPDQPLRFAWGVWPLLMTVLVVPLEVLRDRARPRGLRVAVGVGALLIAAGALRYNVRGYVHEWWANIPRTMTNRAQSAIAWTRLHAHRGDVIAAESEPMIYLYAEQQAVPVTTFTALQYLRPRTTQQNADVLRRIIRASNARYVLVQTAPILDAARALAAAPAGGPQLTLTDSTADLFVFTVGATPGDSTRR